MRIRAILAREQGKQQGVTRVAGGEGETKGLVPNYSNWLLISWRNYFLFGILFPGKQSPFENM